MNPVAMPGACPATTKEGKVTIRHHKFPTCRQAARKDMCARFSVIYHDCHGDDVEVVDLKESSGGKRVEVTLADGRTFPMDWNQTLHVVRA